MLKIIHKYRLFILVALSLISCNRLTDRSRFAGFKTIIDVNNIKPVSGESTELITKIKIPIKDSLGFDYEKRLTNLRYVSLESSPASMIGKIEKIYFSDERIIIVDSRITETVFLFDKNGNFINKIAAKKSESADTFSHDMTHFFSATYSYDDKKIILHDDKKAMLYYYDENGNYIRSQKVYFSFSDCINIKNTPNFVYLSLYKKNAHIPILQENDLYIGKGNGQVTHVVPLVNQTSKLKQKYYYKTNLISSTDKVFYTPMFSNIVYKIDGNPIKVFPKFSIEFEGQTINDIITKKEDINIEEYIRLINSHNYFSFSGKILATNDSIYYIECKKKGQLGYFYSEKSHKIIGGDILSSSNVKDSVDIEFYQFPIASNGKEFVSLMDPTFYDFSGTNLRTSKLNKVLRAFNKNSNPVLLFYNLEPF